MKKLGICLALLLHMMGAKGALLSNAPVTTSEQALVSALLNEDSKDPNSVKSAELAEKLLKSQISSQFDFNAVQLVLALPNKRAQNVLLDRTTLSKEAELALVGLLGGSKGGIAKEILLNKEPWENYSKFLSSQTELALLKMLSDSSVKKRRQAFRVLKGTSTRMLTHTIDILLDLIEHPLAGPLAGILLSDQNDLELVVRDQRKLIAFLGHKSKKVRHIAEKVLQEISRYQNLSPSIQKQLVTEFIFDSTDKIRRQVGLNILKHTERLASSADHALTKLYHSSESIKISKELAQFYRQINPSSVSASRCEGRAFLN